MSTDAKTVERLVRKSLSLNAIKAKFTAGCPWIIPGLILYAIPIILSWFPTGVFIVPAWQRDMRYHLSLYRGELYITASRYPGIGVYYVWIDYSSFDSMAEWHGYHANPVMDPIARWILNQPSTLVKAPLPIAALPLVLLPLAVRPVARRLRGVSLTSRGLCRSCGYDLRGSLQSERCSECGARFGPRHVSRRRGPGMSGP